MTRPRYSTLSAAQFEVLRPLGEERTATADEVLFRAGDPRYPFIAIIDGEVVIQDGAGAELTRHGPGGFLGELDLLSGQSVFVTARAVGTLRYLAVQRSALRDLLFEDGPLSDLLLAEFIRRREALQRVRGAGIEIIGARCSAPTRELIDFVSRMRLPYTWTQTHEDEQTQPRVRLIDGRELSRPSNGALLRAVGIGRELAEREAVDLLIIGGGPAGLAGAVYGASEGLDTLVLEASALGGQAGGSRRIENYLGFPAGISGAELTGRAVLQAHKFHARTATPYRAVSLEHRDDLHRVKVQDGQIVDAKAVVIATGAHYRRLAVAGLEQFEGVSIFYAAGPPEAERCAGARVGVVGGGNSAAQAAVWLARGGALVTLLHRRADLRETMSDYLIAELERYGVVVRDRSEISALHGSDGELEQVTLNDGTQLPLTGLFCFLGATPHTEWLPASITRDDHGFILTGAAAGASNALETSTEGVYAAGDVRLDSIKRCATAVGDGAQVVRLVHQHLTGVPA